MYKAIYDFIKKNKISYKSQFAFQEGKSTEHAILDLYTNIVQYLKQAKSSCVSFYILQRLLILWTTTYC